MWHAHLNKASACPSLTIAGLKVNEVYSAIFGSGALSPHCQGVQDGIRRFVPERFILEDACYRDDYRISIRIRYLCNCNRDHVVMGRPDGGWTGYCLRAHRCLVRCEDVGRTTLVIVKKSSHNCTVATDRNR